MARCCFWLVVLSLISVSLARYEDCENAPNVPHATIQIEDDEDTVHATYSCEAGYELQGNDELICDLDTDEWNEDPPTCVKTDSNDADSEATAAHQRRKKPTDIVEDRSVSDELVATLDMSCVQAKVKAPEIRHGYVQKYDRRRKGERIFLVALYACNDNYELEDASIQTLYCSKQTWVGELPTCIALGEYTEEEEEYDEYEAVDEENGAEEEDEDVEENSVNTHHVAPPPPPPPTYTAQGNEEISNEIAPSVEQNVETTTVPSVAEPVPATDVNIVVEPTQDPYTPRVVDENCGPDNGGCAQKCERLLFPGENEPRLKCSCFEGFSLDPYDYASCHDIDECQLNNGGCEQICHNVPGSFQCGCEQGLQIDTLTGKTCVDINECLLRNGHGPCQDTCHNLWRGYRCSCDGLSGTQLAADNHTCEDAGECAVLNGGCSHICLSSLGRVFCLCPDGFQMSDDDKICQDVNECDVPEIAAQCAGGCENTHGSYRCVPALNTREDAEEERGEESKSVEESDAGIVRVAQSTTDCPAGYKAEGDRCVDIDECAEGSTDCEHCLNTDGSYECTCPGGYDLADDQKHCVDINECEIVVEEDEDVAPYKLCSEGCENTPGSFICTCGPNQHLLEDRRTCAPDSCQDLNNPQLNKTRCAYQCVDLPSGVYECTCPEGYNLNDDLHNCDVAENGCAKEGGYERCAPGSCVSNEDNTSFNCVCPTGYANEEQSCKDIDECATGTHACSHECLNTEGGYQCACPGGYRFVEGSEQVCEDIDECASKPNLCGTLQCVNTPGAFICLCADGTEPNPETGVCAVHDPCAQQQCSHMCIVENGGPQCICPEDMILAANGLNCMYRDFCADNNNGCEQLCKSEEEGACACHSGYQLGPDGKSCTDIDECQMSNGGCHQVCNNHPGTYACACEAGFELAEDRRTCIDIDECAVGRHDCSHVCVNVEGGYECICPDGYVLGEDKARCVDVDECVASEHGCSHGCRNNEGSYECTCPEGYVLAADSRRCLEASATSCSVGTVVGEDGFSCVQVDECRQNNGGCSHICTPQAGCSCPFGLQLAADGKTCHDVDECAHNNGGCTQLCRNSIGSFDCLCDDGTPVAVGQQCASGCAAGFTADPNNPGSCVDIDECATPGVCQYSCRNTNGSYECICPPGYELRNGRDCVDINECLNNNGGCVGGECINHIGSYQCKCPLGQRLAADRRTCEHRTELRDQCTPFVAPANGDFHCTKYRHKRKLFYNTKCKVWCNQGYRLEGPAQRFCNASGKWDDFENHCIPVVCPRIPQPRNAVILPTSCTVGKTYMGERCRLQCHPGYVPIGKTVTVCTNQLQWSFNGTLDCTPAKAAFLPAVPAPAAPALLPSSSRSFFDTPAVPRMRPQFGFGPGVGLQQPYIKCPRNTTVFLANGETRAHIILQKPITNMDYRYIESSPPWTKNLQAHLAAGTYVITFRGQDPVSGKRARCQTVINVRAATSPTVNFCTPSFEVTLSPNQAYRSVVWEEPRFAANLGAIKKIYKSRIPGELFGAGVHTVYYEATNEQGITSRCEFKIVVKAAAPASGSSMPMIDLSYPSRGTARSSPLIHPPPSMSGAKPLAGHESFIICPGQAPVKITSAQTVNLPVGCILKNVRINPLRQYVPRRLFNTQWTPFTAF